MSKKDENFEKETFLMNVSDEMEANIIQSLLESNGVNTLKRHRAAGDFISIYMGSSKFGIDIFVSKGQLQKAKEIIDSEPKLEKEFDEEIEKEQEGNKQKHINKRMKMSWFLIFLISIPIIIAILLKLINRMSV